MVVEKVDLTLRRKARIIFAKEGKAKWLSHLDTMRVLQRAFKRAGVPLEYSSGFNPHMRMSIAIPCPVGFESECEVCDVILNARYDTGELLKLILPEGFRVLEVKAPDIPVKDMKWFDYKMPDGAVERRSAQNPSERPETPARRLALYSVNGERV